MKKRERERKARLKNDRNKGVTVFFGIRRERKIVAVNRVRKREERRHGKTEKGREKGDVVFHRVRFYTGSVD